VSVTAAPIEWRLLTPEERARAGAPRCQSCPSPRSKARCEQEEGHAPESDGRTFHAGRTPGGYWKSWHTGTMTDEAILAVAGVHPDELGRVLRRRWEAWAREQPDIGGHPSWIRPWRALSEREREVDMVMAVEQFCAGWRARDAGQWQP